VLFITFGIASFFWQVAFVYFATRGSTTLASHQNAAICRETRTITENHAK